MNTLILILALIVGLCYFGEKYCPAMLKQNKQILLGVLIGLGSASFMGVGIEGFTVSKECCEAGEMVEYETGEVNPNLPRNNDYRAKAGKTIPDGCNPGDSESPSYTGDQKEWTRRCVNEFPNSQSAEVVGALATYENEMTERRRQDNLRESELSGASNSQDLLSRLANTGK